MLKHYLQLTKPGIVRGNVIAAAAGFFLASQGQIDWLLLLAVCIGTTLIVAAGSVFNNFIDRDIDALMKRTCQRELVKKTLSERHALIFAVILATVGFYILFEWTTKLAFIFGALGFIIYLGLYSLYFKRKSIYGTAIGSLSGACPPVIGYYAVNHQLDVGGAILFIIFFIWQIPHAYAIAIYRFNDYKAASIPVLPIKYGVLKSRYHIITYIIIFLISAMALTYFNYTGTWYAIGMALISMFWLYLATMSYKKLSSGQWGKQLTIFSIVAIMVFCLLISIDFVTLAQVSPTQVSQEQIS